MFGLQNFDKTTGRAERLQPQLESFKLENKKVTDLAEERASNSSLYNPCKEG